MNTLVISLITLISVTVNSDNRLYHASVRYQGGSELRTEAFTLFDQYHEVIYTKNDLDVNTFFISNTGYVFALNEHYLYLYHPDGSEMLLRELAYPNGFGFSRDNSLFFASDKQGVFTYSSDGELRYAFEPGRLYASADNGTLVAIISTDTLLIYENGVLKDIEPLPSPYTRDIRFLDDENSIVVDMPGNSEIYDVQSSTWVRRK